MLTKHFRQMIGFVLFVWLVAGCSGSTPTAPAAVLPTATTVLSTPLPTATTAPVETAAKPAETVVPTQTVSSASGQEAEATRIQFSPNTTRWYTQGDLAPNGAIRFVLSAMRGQQMNIWLNTEPASSDSPLAYLYITDANSKSLLISPEMYFSAVLGTSQDYSIEIRSATKDPVNYTITIEIPAKVIDPALGGMYDLIDLPVCQGIQQAAAEAMGVDFSLEARAPFLDEVAGEAGQGCRLTASGDGTKFASAQSVVGNLVGSAGLGWTEQPAYQADGPTGSATALARDMGLMLIKVNWAPAMGVVCPQDQPISECILTLEQKIYTIQIDVAQYRADFSLDGHWEDAANGFSLDLFQEWKNIWGQHTVVAQNGNKIDSLEASINGNLQGKVATIQFKSSFTSESGTAQITYIDVNTIVWKIITPPDGEYYLPAEATLTRK
jgi:hypothetical protein